MKYFFTLLFLVGSLHLQAQRTVSFTFDDGNPTDRGGYALEEWNGMILDHLDEAGVKAVFFVTGFNKANEKGRQLLQSWNDKGHRIANHTFDHPNYNSPKVSYDDFVQQFLKQDSLIASYEQYIRMFRFPYLKEGNTPEKVARFRAFLEEQNYRNGHVTIDGSDWYVDMRLVKKLRENPHADLEAFKKFYVAHLYEKAVYYDQLAYQLTGRRIKHTLLLHHNLAAALFLDDLIAKFEAEGWNIISAEEAFEDPVFKAQPKHAGESLIWALAKDSGKFEKELRYPAEGMKYEKEKMDELGL